MERDFKYLRDKYTEVGAREVFEKVCTELLQAKYSEKAHRIKANPGDDGIDILIGDFTEPIDNYQCKYFVDEIRDSQKDQIRSSFNTSINSDKYSLKQWVLCIPTEMDLKGFEWWSEWKAKKEKKHKISISLYEGSYLLSQLKAYNLYDRIFDEDVRKSLDEILLYLNEEKERLSLEIIKLLDEMDEDAYKDMVFVRKLENAKINLIEGCKRDFYNAEFVSQEIKSKGNKEDIKQLEKLKLKIYSLWETQFRRYKDDIDGNDLLTKVYQRIEDMDTTTLCSMPNISMLAKKGILHQYAEECSIGWLNDYKQKLDQYLSELRRQENE